jgi:hypothetical protein
MEPQLIRYILTRFVTVIVLIVAILYGLSMFKKKQRKDAIIADLKSVCSDSSFFRQFDAQDARKTLIRGVGLIAEAKQMGIDPDKIIDAGLGIEEKYFAMDGDKKEVPIKQNIIRDSLRSNYENFIKLGYTPDFRTLKSMKEGEIPPLVRTGSSAVGRAEISAIIDPNLSPGIDRVIANMEIRPAKNPGTPMTDVEIASAKQLAKNLSQAQVIEKVAAERIIESLTPKPPEDPDKKK